jgi:hypothetical protein
MLTIFRRDAFLVVLLYHLNFFHVPELKPNFIKKIFEPKRITIIWT